MQPFFGYPGGKSKVAPEIINTLGLGDLDYRTYAEPFAGGFSVGLRLGPRRAWINDFDKDLYSLWWAAINRTEELCELVMQARPTTQMFYDLRDKINGYTEFDPSRVMERAIDKLVIHKISFSSMGEMSGTPLGGKSQKHAQKFDARWKPERICDHIRKVAARLAGAKITCYKYEAVLRSRMKDLLLYVDPPYVSGGPKNYKHAFSGEDHKKLARLLGESKHRWFATYDNNPWVHELYNGSRIQEIRFKHYMTARSKDGDPLGEATELLISNF
jgi:DNA adenine methylase